MQNVWNVPAPGSIGLKSQECHNGHVVYGTDTYSNCVGFPMQCSLQMVNLITDSYHQLL